MLPSTLALKPTLKTVDRLCVSGSGLSCWTMLSRTMGQGSGREVVQGPGADLEGVPYGKRGGSLEEGRFRRSGPESAGGEVPGYLKCKYHGYHFIKHAIQLNRVFLDAGGTRPDAEAMLNMTRVDDSF